jgi:hypothetical protein
MSSSVVSRKIPANIKCVATRRIQRRRLREWTIANAIATEAIRNAFASIARTGDDASLDDLRDARQAGGPYRKRGENKSGPPSGKPKRAAVANSSVVLASLDDEAAVRREAEQIDG